MPALLATLEPDYLDAWLNQFADEVLHDFPSDFVTLLLETGARPDVGWKISVRSAASRH